ncbi:GLPGLI family protein [Algoriphagus sp. D3-2-R+10]|uniref:GLPGLI family protein n=1 Tax=Algoriphagus aurantiacus TaxID=3103948 RepID=UPI002B390FEC|nr:GLPGLI family protein [Algoriphagus sp. D3-2-R+10]MEB2778162.1 GLPGLI family protein [Algoriphagus sp. D3-2-R+10]
MNIRILVLAFALMGSIITVTAQGLTGRAFYKSSSKISFSMDSTKMAPEVMADLQKQLKKQMEREYVLTFSQTESNWKQVESLGAGPSTASSGGATIMINSGNQDRLLYKNVAEQNYIEEEDLMGRGFLVKDSLNTYDWELTGESKKIGDYTCQKAIYSRIVDSRVFSMGKDEMEVSKDTVNVTAWFTMQIPVSHGPGDFWGLPGLILELQNDGMTYIAERIVLNPTEPVQIEIPKKGEMISREDYQALSEEKMNEMMKRYSGKPGEGNEITIKIGN